MKCPICGSSLDTGFNCPNCGYKQYEQQESIRPELTKADVEIEEMAKVLLPAWGKCPREKCPEVRKDLNSCDYCKCELLYAAGYRKQSDTIKEFAVKLLSPLIKAYNQSYKASGYDMEAAIRASEIKHYIDHIKQTAEQFGKEEI